MEPGIRASPDFLAVLACDDRAVNPTVLIVDDHSGFRSWTRSLLETEGFPVIGEAADGKSALATARALRPELVLLDVMLGDTTGFVVAKELARLPSPPAVILISSREASDFGDAIGRSPALGFISKPELSGWRLRALLGAPS
jgi:DNA-binding NarL/FixJ family response regulator